jgi:hypothetical protein
MGACTQRQRSVLLSALVCADSGGPGCRGCFCAARLPGCPSWRALPAHHTWSLLVALRNARMVPSVRDMEARDAGGLSSSWASPSPSLCLCAASAPLPLQSTMMVGREGGLSRMGGLETLLRDRTAICFGGASLAACDQAGVGC